MEAVFKTYKNEDVINMLNRIYQHEMAGVTMYLHYSFMIMGHNRIPIQGWFRANANESMQHAIMIGEKITSIGGHPEIAASAVKESNNHSIQQLLQESYVFEEEGLKLYIELSKLCEKYDDIALEELARTQVQAETEHLDEVRKMLTPPN